MHGPLRRRWSHRRLQWTPWLYPLYYVLLLVPRERDDNELCKEKYSEKVWSEYCRQVPYRMVPYVY